MPGAVYFDATELGSARRRLRLDRPAVRKLRRRFGNESFALRRTMFLMRSESLIIYLAHGDDGRRRVLEANLELLSHRVELSTASPAVLQRRCQENPPAVAVVGTCFKDADCFDVLNELGGVNACPVVAILHHDDVERSRRLLDDQVMGVLVEPVNEGDLRTAIYLARRRFQQSKQMKQRIHDLEDELKSFDGGHGDAES